MTAEMPRLYCGVRDTRHAPLYSSPSCLFARTLAQTLDIPHAEQGFIAAGTRISEGRRHHCHHHQTHVLPPLTAQTKFLLSRSLQRRLTHFSRVCSPDTIRVSFSKLQAAVKEAAFSLLQIPQDPTPPLRWASHTLLFASNCAYPSEKVALT